MEAVSLYVCASSLVLPNLVQCRFTHIPPCPDFWMLTGDTLQFMLVIYV